MRNHSLYPQMIKGQIFRSPKDNFTEKDIEKLQKRVNGIINKTKQLL